MKNMKTSSCLEILEIPRNAYTIFISFLSVVFIFEKIKLLKSRLFLIGYYYRSIFQQIISPEVNTFFLQICRKMLSAWSLFLSSVYISLHHHGGIARMFEIYWKCQAMQTVEMIKATKFLRGTSRPFISARHG